MKETERYNPSKKEKCWQAFWQEKKIYEFDPELSDTVFSVDSPPPTISGALHLGHIFSYVQAEVVARFKRMEGKNVRYPIGYDNNGLPTERLVEKELGKRAQDMKLSEFVKSCLLATKKYREIYEKLFKSAGFSMDWRLEYSTISSEVQKLSQTVFKELFDKGYLYKKNTPALYCTECRTSFAQAEKEDDERDSIFFDLLFKTDDGKDLTISTTRPEMLPACVAVFVNPKDKRYINIVGKKAKTPLRQEVSVIADEKVDTEKGSGAVMCCTYGDETDIYWTKKHNLRERIILDKDGKIINVDEIPEINGEKINTARKVIVEILRKDGFIVKEEKITHSVGTHERCGTLIEFLPTTQWFMKMLDMKDKLLEAGDDITWYPSYMKKRYDQWISGLKWDWCISRERFYGIPIPAYNCDSCDNVVIPDKETFPVDPKNQKTDNHCPNCKKGSLIAETNVLDTWFTSSLTPDINSENQLNGPLKNKLYPASMRPLGHDIIRTWVVYSILMGLHRHNEVPWNELMISGHILLRKGEKISKRAGGGGYSPDELIAEKSADAIRYAMCGAILGKDAYFDEQEVEKGKKLATKLFNAGKLVLSKLVDFDPKSEFQTNNLLAFDRWILLRSLDTAKKMATELNRYEFFQARKLFEEYFWSDFCDNYLEIAKGRLSIDTNEKEKTVGRVSAQYAIYHSFLNILKMASPFVPHITEEMYHADIFSTKNGDYTNDSIESNADHGYFYKNEGTLSIHKTIWPKTENFDKIPEDVAKDTNLALKIISETRKIKTERNIRLGATVSRLLIKCSENEQKGLKPYLDDISSVMRAQEIVLSDGNSLEVLIEE